MEKVRSEGLKEQVEWKELDGLFIDYRVFSKPLSRVNVGYGSSKFSSSSFGTPIGFLDDYSGGSSVILYDHEFRELTRCSINFNSDRHWFKVLSDSSVVVIGNTGFFNIYAYDKLEFSGRIGSNIYCACIYEDGFIVITNSNEVVFYKNHRKPVSMGSVDTNVSVVKIGLVPHTDTADGYPIVYLAGIEGELLVVTNQAAVLVSTESKVCDLAVSPDNTLVAIYYDDNSCTISDSSLSMTYSKFNVNEETKPLQISWLGSSVPILVFPEVVYIVSSGMKSISLVLNNPIIIEMIDSALVLTEDTVNSLTIITPGHINAQMNNSTDPDDLMDAAKNSFDPSASKYYLNTLIDISPADISNEVKMLRILSCIRMELRLFITYYQLEQFTVDRLVTKLSRMQKFSYAMDIAKFYGVGGVQTEWGKYIIDHYQDEKAVEILGDRELDWIDLACYAFKSNRKSLARDLGSKDTSATRKAMYYANTEEWNLAIEMAGLSSDTDMMVEVISKCFAHCDHLNQIAFSNLIKIPEFMTVLMNRNPTPESIEPMLMIKIRKMDKGSIGDLTRLKGFLECLEGTLKTPIVQSQLELVSGALKLAEIQRDNLIAVGTTFNRTISNLVRSERFDLAEKLCKKDKGRVIVEQIKLSAKSGNVDQLKAMTTKKYKKYWPYLLKMVEIYANNELESISRLLPEQVQPLGNDDRVISLLK